MCSDSFESPIEVRFNAVEISMKPDLRAVDGVSFDVYEGQRS